MVIKTKKINKIRKRSHRNKNKKSLKKIKIGYSKHRRSHNKKKEIKKKEIQQGGATGGTVCAPYVIEGNKTNVAKDKKVQIVKSVHTESCLTPAALNKLVQAWNKETINPKYKISTNSTPAKMYESMLEIFNQTNSRLLPEHEWWQQPWVKKHLSTTEITEIKEKHYSPDAPEKWLENPIEWLSTLDIDAKLEQYEKKYPEFKYFGATPIDFDLKSDTGSCQVNSLCNINLGTLLNQKTPKKYIGVVFNFDKHYEPGSHWIALFVNIPKAEINYWDSYAVSPPTEVESLMNKIATQGSKLPKPIKFKKNINKIRHQYKGSECGVYSCNFIIEQLEGKSFDQVVNTVIPDDKMNERRKEFFNMSTLPNIEV
jgi:hypothetical protein